MTIINLKRRDGVPDLTSKRKITMLKKWEYCGYTVTADRSEVFEDDPGAGTPCLVSDKNGNCGTFWCALEEEELDGYRIPTNVRMWLEGIQESVEEYLYD